MGGGSGGGWNLFNSDIKNPVARAIFMVLDPAGGAAKTMSMFGSSDFASEVEYAGQDEPEPSYGSGGASSLLTDTSSGGLSNGELSSGVKGTNPNAGGFDTAPDNVYAPGASQMLNKQSNIYTWV